MEGRMSDAGKRPGVPEPLAENAVVPYLQALGFEASSPSVWAGRVPNVCLRVTGHATVERHTLYEVDCCLQRRGEGVAEHGDLSWRCAGRLKHIRKGLHDLVKQELGNMYQKHFAGLPFARRMRPSGTTARLAAWLRRLAHCMSVRALTPAVAAAALRFLGAPTPSEMPLPRVTPIAADVGQGTCGAGREVIGSNVGFANAGRDGVAGTAGGGAAGTAGGSFGIAAAGPDAAGSGEEFPGPSATAGVASRKPALFDATAGLSRPRNGGGDGGGSSDSELDDMLATLGEAELTFEGLATDRGDAALAAAPSASASAASSPALSAAASSAGPRSPARLPPPPASAAASGGPGAAPGGGASAPASSDLDGLDIFADSPPARATAVSPPPPPPPPAATAAEQAGPTATEGSEESDDSGPAPGMIRLSPAKFVHVQAGEGDGDGDNAAEVGCKKSKSWRRKVF